VVGLIRKWKYPVTGLRHPYAGRFFWSVVLVVIATLSVGGVSIYHLICQMPGASAIRAVTRVIVVLLFPVAGILAYNIDCLMAGMGNKNFLLRYGLVAMIFACLVLDQWTNCGQLPYEELTRRTAPYARVLAVDNHLHHVFGFLPTGDMPMIDIIFKDLDVMLACQTAGYASLNGISGNQPKDYPEVLETGRSAPDRTILSWIEETPLALVPGDILMESGDELPAPARALMLPMMGFDTWERSESGASIWSLQKRANCFIPVAPRFFGRSARLTFTMRALRPGEIRIRVNNLVQTVKITDASQGVPVSMDIPLTRSIENLRFSASQKPQMPLNGDRRHLVFYLADVQLRLLPGPVE